MCKFVPRKKERKNIINQFVIPERDKTVFPDIETAVRDALSRSFLDISFRTLTDKTDNYPELQDGKTITDFLIEKLDDKKFIEKFVTYFSSEKVLDKTEFDKWHHEACQMFLKVLIEYYSDAKYGKAQKIVNMMFKHLYCMNFGKDTDNWLVLDERFFTHCHLTLDSFTLEWFYREVVVNWYNKKKIGDRGDQIHKGKFDSWSNLGYSDSIYKYKEYIEVKRGCENKGNCRLIKTGKNYFYHYLFFVDVIRKFFDVKIDPTEEQKRYAGKTPFKAEFYIWPDIQLHLTAEALFGQSIGQNETMEDLEKMSGKKFSDFKDAQKFYRSWDRKNKIKLLKKKIQHIQKLWK